MKIKNTLLSILITVLLTGCGLGKVTEKANQAFGDQHFKTAIALIELYNIREGKYPESLDSLKYLGDWDQIIFTSVGYKKLEEGYELDLLKGWMGKPTDLEYPEDFWKGLGLKKSNLKRE